MLKLFVTTACALALAACVDHRVYGSDPAIKLSDQQGLPAPQDADLYGSARPYLIGPFDKLTIKVFGVQDMDMRIQADASGRISFPLAGVIQASGQTPDQVAKAIEGRLRGYVRNPQVSVNLEETVSQVFTVDGEVREPGLYPVVGRMTLLRAIATAKGTGEYARLDDVIVFRTVGGQRMAGIYNLRAIRLGNYADPEIYPGDIVVVGDSKARRIFKDVLLATPAILTPLIYILAR
ncbi:polysaccharide export protein [Sphingomonas sp. CBMAI 2297]|uniref:polysaccharide biosynthesis/export family protein n=1 Tax=Sphingomonas sp. CBMAI 2297 TaxID=2991720 RepID=UPI00245504F8|nr:polysaccharide biosynthesis/export family protein [Sphingomonas sp. CBMAI 2297]MDH4742999.1 polysaccharide export protein [Sphingomonas sp. CBMAI 2297]